MDNKPPTTRPIDERLRGLSPEAVIQRLYHGGMSRLGRLLEARSASAAHEVDRQTVRHGAEAPATKAARSQAVDMARLARAARIDGQRSATAPRRAAPDERVLLARLVDDQGGGVACLETQLLDQAGAVVATATSDAVGQVRLSYRSKEGRDSAPAPAPSAAEQPREATAMMPAAAPVRQAKEPSAERPRDHVLTIRSGSKQAPQQVPVAVSTGQTTVIEVLVGLPACPEPQRKD